MRIGIVVSSTRPTRIGPRVAAWVAEHAPEGVEAEIVDLAELDLPFLSDLNHPKLADYTEPSTIAWSETVQRYDALIVAVPEYNASYPAPLKNAIDSIYVEWDGKPIGVVGYGWGGAARAVTALVPVLAHVKAVPVVGPGLSFTTHLTPEGEMLDAAPAGELVELYAALEAMVPATV
ncbi:NADPH-dependent FMN reductase [Ornithinimicrobium flavum]|uniref:NADPH-dependent FMN reductase n=1 Tax=Ornithinimicrobium flavum TaxID=1288636 RepID=UPI001EE88C70|nr:NAD(P)H-dependent oxidoreductase [Ornithinimicrobium flavum]